MRGRCVCAPVDGVHVHGERLPLPLRRDRAGRVPVLIAQPPTLAGGGGGPSKCVMTAGVTW